MGYIVDPTPCLNYTWWPFSPSWLVGVDDALWKTYTTPYSWPLCYVPPLYRLEMSAHPRGSPLINFALRLPSVIAGLVLNVIVLKISFFSKEMKHNFKYFLGNLALCDFLFCLFSLWDVSLHLLFSWFHLPMSIDICTMQREPHKILGYCILYATPLISFNRFVVVVLGKGRIFNNKLFVFLLCLTSYIPIVVMLVFSLALSTAEAVPDEFCGFVFNLKYVTEILAAPLALLFVAVICCNAALYYMLRGHFAAVSQQMQKTEVEIKEEKSVLRATILQVVAPLICGLPIAGFIAVKKYMHFMCQKEYETTWKWVAHLECSRYIEEGILNNKTIGYFTDQLFYFYPAVDAALSLSIKSYREMIQKWRNKPAFQRTNRALSSQS